MKGKSLYSIIVILFVLGIFSQPCTAYTYGDVTEVTLCYDASKTTMLVDGKQMSEIDIKFESSGGSEVPTGELIYYFNDGTSKNYGIKEISSNYITTEDELAQYEQWCDECPKDVCDDPMDDCCMPCYWISKTTATVDGITLNLIVVEMCDMTDTGGEYSASKVTLTKKYILNEGYKGITYEMEDKINGISFILNSFKACTGSSSSSGSTPSSRIIVNAESSGDLSTTYTIRPEDNPNTKAYRGKIQGSSANHYYDIDGFRVTGYSTGTKVQAQIIILTISQTPTSFEIDFGASCEDDIHEASTESDLVICSNSLPYSWTYHPTISVGSSTSTDGWTFGQEECSRDLYPGLEVKGYWPSTSSGTYELAYEIQYTITEPGLSIPAYVALAPIFMISLIGFILLTIKKNQYKKT